MLFRSQGVDNKVDVKLKLEEQNRNQLTFGAGVSQFEGFFGQLSFQTSNFLGRGESLTLSLQAGSRAQNYQLALTEIADVYQDPIVLARNPFLRDSLLIGQGGERVISRVVPSIVHNTVDNPIFPSAGKRYTLSMDLAGLGGNTNFYKPTLEGVWYWKQSNRLTLGTRAQYEYIHTFTGKS